VRWKKVMTALVLGSAAVYFSSTEDSEKLGFAYRGEFRASDIQLLVDETWVDVRGKRHVQQEIFESVFEIIDEAEEFILIDFFLVNDFLYLPGPGMRPLSQELSKRIVAKRKANPEVEIVFITDPLNTVYESIPSKAFGAMEAAGVEVVWTDLDQLPDSNPIISKPWRLFIKPFGLGPGTTAKNPLGEGTVSLRSLFKLLNFKANHRKVVATEKSLLITSANPHDGSSAHWNTALRINGAGTEHAIVAEAAVMNVSGTHAFGPTVGLDRRASRKAMQSGGRLGDPSLPKASHLVELLTEIRIKEKALDMLGRVGQGDRAELTMFYLSEKDIISALIAAKARGGDVRVILDPNKDAFGRVKNGIPNRQSAFKLTRAGIPVRWADTHGEQCHVKMLLTEYAGGNSELMLGSCNYTRRNLDNFNAECDLAMTAPSFDPNMVRARETFKRWWNNEEDRFFTVDYDVYKDEALRRRIRSAIMEATGLCTF
jgi:phosphatidylserine/phosphatidylglycerophosphate/cardiolipin synthase-like enzyme